jgi:hypothetical protein
MLRQVNPMTSKSVLVFSALAVLIVATVVQASSAAAAVGNDPGVLPAGERIPIIAYPGIPHKFISAERYREFADAGFTHGLWNEYPDLDTMQTDLDLANAVGVKLIIGGPELEKNPEAVAKRFRKHPGLGGYYVSDEPGVAKFAQIAALTKRILAVDRDHWATNNLFPITEPGALGCPTYQEYIARFVTEVPFQAISFDHYPSFYNDFDTTWYENLDIVAKAAQKTGKSFWAFTFSTGCNQYTPKLANLRIEAFTNLAYGAQAIEHFTYWTMSYAGWTWHDAPISSDGKRTATYDIVKQVNEEITGLSPVFMDSKLLAIGHVGTEKPKGIEPFAAKQPLRSIAADGRGVLVALHVKEGRKFLIIINRDLTKAAPVAIEFDGKKTIAQVDKHAAMHSVESKSVKPIIEPGDIAIYTWNDR